IGNRLGRITPLGDVLSEMTFADGPPAECRDVRVVGTHRTRSPALTSEVTGILAKMARVQLIERRRALLVVGEKLDKPIELSARILTVVPALATLAFPFVRQEILDDCIDLH